MIKNIKKIALILSISTSLFALTEGKEYNILENPIPNSNNTLTEVWSYQCSHCYLHQAYGTLDVIKEQLKDLKINMMMAKTWGKFGKEMANLLAYAKHQDSKNKIGIYDKESLYYNVSKIYFIDLFKNNANWQNEDEFYDAGFKLFNISKKQLETFTQSPEGKYLLKSTDIADDIANLVGTPAFVVNGKYVINLAHVNSPQDLVDIIKQLLELK